MKEIVNMGDSVGRVTETQAAEAAAEVRQRSADPRPRAVPVDKVQLTREAQAALREAGKTPEESAKGPGTGDAQVKQLLAQHEAAKEEAAKQAAASTTHVVA
jgi:hypothetical protein